MKIKGFTLAEVLITLGIIGIVAAMTLPAVTGKYRKKVVETKLKRFYSVANAAVKASELDNGSWDYWYFETNDTIENTKQWYDTYLAKYWKTVKAETINDGYVVAYFPDGSLCVIKSGINYFYYPEAKKFDKQTFSTQRFSQYGKDIFVFSFFPQRQSDKTHYKKGIEPFLTTKATINDDGELVWSGTVETIEELYNDAAYGCNLSNNTGGAAFCTKIIQINGWVIPNDYPFKF